MGAARLETLTLDKELRLSTLLDKQNSDPLGDPHLPPQCKHKEPKRPRRHLQEDPQVASHRRDRQEDHQEAHHKQQHRNKRYRYPMGQMGLWKDNHLPSLMEKDRRRINS